MNDQCLLLDSRAAFLESDEFEDSMIMLIGNPKECCDAANDNEYGDNCVVTDLHGNVYWEWFATNNWIPN